MIQRKFKEIVEEDINSLIKNSVAEGKTIEYKEQLPSGTDSEKKEFLADISSFANAGGGDLLYGVKEDKGLPTAIVGLESSNSDAELNRMENIAMSGIDPRISYAMRAIKLSDGKFVIVIRIRQSWIKPHRVVFGGHDKFYGRNSIGKYPLDVEELRAVFNFSQSVAKRIQDFRVERILNLNNSKTPVSMPKETGKLVVHLIPFQSFNTQTNIDMQQLLQLKDDTNNFRPVHSRGWSYRVNLNGVIAYDGGGDDSYSYVQVYRNGIIEYVDGAILWGKKDQDGNKVIPSRTMEEVPLQGIPLYLNILKSLDVVPPIFVFLTLIGVEGQRMGYSRFNYHFDDVPIADDILYLPEAVIENYDQELTSTLKPMFDLVWNACGIPHSLNFDKDGNWIRS